MMNRSIYTYAQEAEVAELVSLLVANRGQFAVCPFPDDIRVAERTGWVVSWPSEAIPEVETDGDVAA